MTFQGLRADGGEMCHRKQSSKESHTQRKFVLLHMLSILPPPQRRMYGPLITTTLCLHPLTSSLPVSNSDQSVGKELAEGKEEDTRQKATHGCVCATRLRLLQPQHPRRRPRACSGLFQLFWTSVTLRNYITSSICFIEYKLHHLLAVISQLCCVQWDVRSQ